jgi:hypothetical protein
MQVNVFLAQRKLTFQTNTEGKFHNPFKHISAVISDVLI